MPPAGTTARIARGQPTEGPAWRPGPPATVKEDLAMRSDLSQQDITAIVACTICRDVQKFDLLVADMEDALGEAWSALEFCEALAFFDQPLSEKLEFVAIAIDSDDETDLDLLGEVIIGAKARGIMVVLIAEDVSPAVLHSLLRRGADEFVPYPLPENELKEIIDRIRKENDKVAATAAALSAGPEKAGAVLVVHGLAGGVGATSMAVNLAWELASLDKAGAPSVCLIDFDLQFGSVATHLDLPRREAVFDMLSDTGSLDDESFAQSLLTFQDRLHVLTAPADVLPLDFINGYDVARILKQARRHFDYVVIDMPGALTGWTEAVLAEAHVYFTLIELDMRSAQNALRLKRALQSEELPVEKLRFVMNRAPKFTDLSGKARLKRMADSLSISIDVHLPDGGSPVGQAADHGLPLAQSAAKNPLRREIARLARSIHDLGKADVRAA